MNPAEEALVRLHEAMHWAQKAREAMTHEARNIDPSDPQARVLAERLLAINEAINCIELALGSVAP